MFYALLISHYFDIIVDPFVNFFLTHVFLKKNIFDFLLPFFFLIKNHSLYGNISNIVWDYSSENVKGMITSSVGEPTKMFDIDPSAASEFDITNQLWELMD